MATAQWENLDKPMWRTSSGECIPVPALSNSHLSNIFHRAHRDRWSLRPDLAQALLDEYRSRSSRVNVRNPALQYMEDLAEGVVAGKVRAQLPPGDYAVEVESVQHVHDSIEVTLRPLPEALPVACVMTEHGKLDMRDIFDPSKAAERYAAYKASLREASERVFAFGRDALPGKFCLPTNKPITLPEIRAMIDTMIDAGTLPTTGDRIRAKWSPIDSVSTCGQCGKAVPHGLPCSHCDYGTP